MPPDPSYLIYILFALLFSAFFSGMEIAYLSSNRLKIELERQQGTGPGKLMAYFVRNQSRFLATMLLGNNASHVVYGMCMAALLTPILTFADDSPALLMTTESMISTVIIIFVAEFIPKALFRINPNRSFQLGLLPLIPIYGLLFIPMLITTGLSKLILRIFGVKTTASTQVFSRVDLDDYVRDLSDRLREEDHMENEIQILQNALEFPELKARDCMIPRTEIIALNIEDSIDELKEKFIETGLSKILIYRESIDHIIGYVHAYELFNKPLTIKEILLPVSIVPEAVLLKDLLEQLTRKKKTIAVVVDEFGGTAGLVTVEDIVEEIFGDIVDEHDKDLAVEQKIDEDTWIFSGRLEIDYINHEYDLGLKESEDYDTLAGLVLNELEDIPKTDQSFEDERHVFTVTAVEESRIEQVKIKVK